MFTRSREVKLNFRGPIRSLASADSKGLFVQSTTWNFRVWHFPSCSAVRCVSPRVRMIDPSNNLSLTELWLSGGDPFCNRIDRSRWLITLHEAPVSSWHSIDVLYLSWMQNVNLARTCLPLLAIAETTSTVRTWRSESVRFLFFVFQALQLLLRNFVWFTNFYGFLQRQTFQIPIFHSNDKPIAN